MYPNFLRTQCTSVQLFRYSIRHTEVQTHRHRARWLIPRQHSIALVKIELLGRTDPVRETGVGSPPEFMVGKVSFKPGVQTAGCMDGNSGDSRKGKCQAERKYSVD